MPTCQTCSYDSPAGAKFCRQCGAPLFAESEMSGADTRNYGRQEAAPAGSAPLPPVTPSVVDAFGGDTSRYYQAPVGAVAGTAGLGSARPMVVTPAYMPPISNTTRLKGKWKRCLLKGAAYLALLIGVAGIGAAINEESHDERPAREFALSAADRNRIEIGRRFENILGATDETLRDTQERVKRLLEKHLQSIHEQRDTARRLAESRNTASLTEIIPVDLAPFEYPHATVGNYVRIPGHELVVQQTKDSFAAINQFYQKKLGKPLFAVNEDDRNRLIFQSGGSPSVVVKISESDQRDDQWEITILRSPFPFSKPDEVLAAAVSSAAEGQAVGKAKGEPRPVAKPAAPGQNPKEPE